MKDVRIWISGKVVNNLFMQRVEVQAAFFGGKKFYEKENNLNSGQTH